MGKSKSERLELIRTLITERIINSQDTLLNLLSAEGHEITQATLSRDLKRMHIAKVPDVDGIYRYRLSRLTVADTTNDRRNAPLLHSGVNSIEFSSSAAVIKTQPGYANVAAGIIDRQPVAGVMGTLAGDDTVLLILRDGFDKSVIMQELSELIPNIQDKLI